LHRLSLRASVHAVGPAEGDRTMPQLQDRMDKILQELEDSIIITNPKERVRTFFRKVAYRIAVGLDWIRRLFTRHPDQTHR
jgi:hypothetical protein